MKHINNMRPKLKIMTAVLAGLLCGNAFAQQPAGTVSGTVRDEAGQPLPGATVLVQGTSNGTMTDASGAYTLKVPAGSTLQAMFVGFETVSKPVGGKAVIDFVLREDKTMLDDVVVIGYGQARKSDLTGSVATVKMGDLQGVPAYSVDNALQGRVAGADIMTTTGEPGSVTTIRIRGTRSITASNEPLIVVDGVVDAINDLNDVNPDDIASISILKDASSTAIYGSRGANGVILITTKQAKAGISRPSVNFTAGVGFSQLPRKLDVMDAAEFALYRNDCALSGGDVNNAGVTTETPLSGYTYANPFGKTGTDWVDEVTRTAWYQNYGLSLSGRDKNSNYLASIAWNDTEGIIQRSGQEKISARIKVSRTLYKWLTASYNGFYVWRDQQPAKASIGGTAVINSAQYLSPMIRPIDDFNPFYDGGQRFNNPRALIDKTVHHRYYNTSTHSLTLDVTPLKNLAVKSILSYSNFQRHQFRYYMSTLPLKAENDGGEAYREEFDSKSFSSETTVKYTVDKILHKFNAMLGFSGYRTVTNDFSLSGKGYTDDNILWNNMNAVMDKETYSASTDYTAVNKMSLFARVNYSYKSRYYLTVTGRTDGASNFAADHKWAFFPSAAFRWKISKEPWMRGVKWVDDLSMRLSAGRTGNDAIAAYKSIATLSSTTSGYLFDGSQPAAVYRKNVATPDLTWEKTDSYNIGIDISSFGKRLNVELEGYWSRTTDLLLNVQKPTQTGFSSRLANVGTTSNKGVELTVETVNIQKKRFQWLTSFTFSHNRQMVEDIGTEDFVTAFNSLGTSKYMMYGYVKGYPLNSLWGFKYGGTWKSQDEVARNQVTHTYASNTTTTGSARYYDVNYDGSLNQDDLIYLGNSDPFLYGGLQNSFWWHNLKVGVYFVYSLGGKIYNISEMYMAGSVYTNQYRYMLGAWHPVRNPQSEIPAAGSKPGASLPSDFMVHDASYLRLKTLDVSYTFDLRKSSIPVKEITVGASGDNLILWKRYNGFDPDVNSEGSSSVLRRVDIGAYPKCRTIMFNLKMTF